VRTLRLLLVALVALIASACQVDAVIDVVVTEDGSGTVTLTAAFDEEIVEAAPELLDGLRTDDLAASGWTVDGPRRAESGGSVIVSANKAFLSPDDLAGVLDEIAGENTLFSDFEVERTRSFARTTYDVTGQIDPQISLAEFGDSGITGLVGNPLGLSLAELAAAANRPLEETVNLTFTITLPDTVTANGADVEGRVASWQLSPQDPLPTDIEVSSSIEDRLPRVWAAVALVALALLGTLLIFRVAS